MPTPPPAPNKPDLSRDLDHNGIVDAADDRSKDLNHDNVIDGNDRQERDLNRDNTIDGTDQKLRAQQKVGDAMGWKNEGGSWTPPENKNSNSQQIKQGPRIG